MTHQPARSNQTPAWSKVKCCLHQAVRPLRMLSLAAWLIFSGQCMGQRAPFFIERFGRAQGLSYSEVNCVFQDRLGYMWFGTWDGLCRFDGYDFECWHSDPEDVASLPYNEILSLCEAPGGDLLIGTSRGLGYFDRSTEQLRVGIPSPAGMRCPSVFLFSTIKDAAFISAEGSLLLQSESQLWLMPPAPAECAVPPGIDGVNSFLIEGNQLRVATSTGIRFFKSSNGRLEEVAPWPRLQAALSGLPVLRMAATPAGEVCMAASDALYFQHTGKDEWQKKKYPFPAETQLTAMHLSASGELWLGTHEGLWCLSPNSEEWLCLRHEEGNPHSLSDNYIRCLYEDRSGLLWVGTRTGGVNRLHLRSSPFHQHAASIFEKGASTEVFSFSESAEGRVWVGTNQGLFAWNRDAESLTSFPFPAEWKVANDKGTLLCLLEEAGGGLLAGTRALGLLHYDFKAGKWTELNAAFGQQDIRKGPLRKLKTDAEGNLWLAHSTGFYRRPAGEKQFIFLKSDSVWNPQGWSPLRPYSWDLEVSPSGQLALAGTGLEVWNGAKAIRSNVLDLLVKTGEADGKYSVLHISALAQNGFLLGTYGNGLIEFYPDEKKLRRFTTANGLPNDYVYAALPDEEGDYWLSTNNGIACLSLSSGKVRCYGPAQGLWMKEFESNSFLKTRDGEIWFGGNEGFLRFYPAEVKALPLPRPLQPVLAAMKVNGILLRADSCLADKRVLQLQAGENQFSISFFSPDLLNAEANRFRYRLLPFEKNWTEVSGKSEAVYRQLAPGQYDFEIVSVGEDGSQSAVRRLHLSLAAYWYQTLLFRVAVVVLVLLLAVALVAGRMRRVRERARKALQEQARDLDRQLLKMRMDQHFTFNSLNSIHHFLAENKTEEAQFYLAKFGKLIREALKVTGTRYHSLAEEAELLRLYLDLETLRGAGAFTTEIIIDPSLELNAIQVPPLLVQPLLENAIWHGLMPRKSGGRLSVKVQAAGAQLVWTITDNGVGRAQAQASRAKSLLQKPSRGISLVQQTLDLLRNAGEGENSLHFTDLHDEQGHACGTQVILKLPILHL